MNVRTNSAIVCCGAWLLLAGDAVRAEDAVDQARSVLKDSGDIPWYDRDSDRLRPLHPRPHTPPDDPLRRSTWQSATKAPTVKPAAPPRPAGTAGSFTLSPLLQTFGLVLLASALVLVTLMLLFKARLQKWFASVEAEEVVPVTSQNIDQVDALPVPVHSADGDLLAEARRRYEAGDYGAAVVFLFSYQLLQLDRHRIIRLAKGKTNRRYLREAAQIPELRGLLERTMTAFEDVFFGRHTLERERFEACWAGLDEFHRRLEQAPT